MEYLKNIVTIFFTLRKSLREIQYSSGVSIEKSFVVFNKVLGFGVKYPHSIENNRLMNIFDDELTSKQYGILKQDENVEKKYEGLRVYGNMSWKQNDDGKFKYTFLEDKDSKIMDHKNYISYLRLVPCMENNSFSLSFHPFFDSNTESIIEFISNSNAKNILEYTSNLFDTIGIRINVVDRKFNTIPIYYYSAIYTIDMP